MEKVKDLILYQIVKSRKFSIGDKIIFDKNTITGQYKKVFQTKYQIDNLRLADIFYYFKKNRGIIKNHAESLAYICDNYDLLVRELALENVRKNFYPDLPSRLHCMYLSLYKQTAVDNYEKSRENHLQVIAVKLNGKIFKSGNFVLGRDGGSFEDYIAKAHNYWTQTDVTDENVTEILFEGEAEVVEIIKER